MGLFSPTGLVGANAAVTISEVSVTQGSEGGTVEAFGTTVATGVPCLITTLGADRSGTYGTDAQRNSGTLSGVSGDLFRSDVRLTVTTPPTNRPEMAGWVLRVDSVAAHPGGQYQLAGQRVTARWSRVDVPAAT